MLTVRGRFDGIEWEVTVFMIIFRECSFSVGLNVSRSILRCHATGDDVFNMTYKTGPSKVFTVSETLLKLVYYACLEHCINIYK